MKPVSVSPLTRCIDIFGVQEGNELHQHLKDAAFRSASSLQQQIAILQQLNSAIRIRDLVKLLSISNYKYYKAILNQAPDEDKAIETPSRRLFSDEEEQIILEKIKEHQLNHDCCTGKEVRDIVAEMFMKKTGKHITINRNWLKNFRQRHSDNLCKVKTNSVDDQRANMSVEEVEAYIQNIEKLIQNPPIPQLLINFDETGFGRRPDKGKQKSVYCIKGLPVKPYWREKTDNYHVSLVAGITAACTSIRPLLISTRKTMDAEINKTFIERWANYFPTSKGYMTTESMLYYVSYHLAPYIQQIRSIFGKDQRCVIIADGCSSHFNPKVVTELEKIGNIEIIPLPPHSSHISQMLDAAVFASVKKRFASISGDPTLESKFIRKLARIKKAYETAVSDDLIRSAWEATGFSITINKGQVVAYSLKEEFKSILRGVALKQEPVLPNQ
ncbi:hypothetical protein TRFO_30039 [Tritrichomonas foetus]|uniref:HTH CENPB-type domain-containing protein n=1 Tax=Tritrichomonas foetus TaxID=1144522 RepID=A0A1J4JZ52_9EUKA|nr:hypothetical protein TRFO_30039 [Tritrichomonas foetus]|eukprot:OHT02774.1 hypothetical protein TRFO_30039 [Tritrichomonas foetus]